jgi:DNA recombination protein RmuC
MVLNIIMPIILFLSGLMFGAAAIWLVFRRKIHIASVVTKEKGEVEKQLAILNERIDGKDREISEYRDQKIPELRNDIKSKDDQIKDLRDEITSLKTSQVELKTLVENERIAAQEKIKLLDEAQSRLTEAFKALSADALKSNNQSFLLLAKSTLEKFQETAKGDLDKRQQAISDLVLPIKESLKNFDSKIHSLEKARVGAYEGLHQQVRSLLEIQNKLRDETSNLVKALGTPRVRGRWGEIQLKRVVEIAGMLDYCDFYKQQSVTTEEGRLRPDLIVKLPGGKNIIVDAKAPLSGYLESIDATNEKTRLEKLDNHARHIREHITALGRKSYWDQFQPAPEFVILFLPGETFFSAALERDPSLIEQGVEKRVILSTPTTLIAVLRAVAYGWRQEKLAENAKAISDLGKELYKRIGDMSGHIADIGSKLRKAIESYNNAIGSLETRVLVSARRFKEFEASGTAKQIETPASIEITPRQLQAPELSQAEDTNETGTTKLLNK